MADDELDLYADLQQQQRQELIPPKPLPPWRRQQPPPPTQPKPQQLQQQQQQRPMMDDPDKEDSEAVKALLEKLMTTEGLEMDDMVEPLEEPLENSKGEISKPHSGSIMIDPLAPETKKPRLSEPTAPRSESHGISIRKQAGNVGGDDDMAFDFEVDLANSCGQSHLATVVKTDGLLNQQHKADGREERPRPRQAQVQYGFNPATQRWEAYTPPSLDSSSSATSQPTASKKAGLCRNFMGYGFCRWGEQCYWVHSEKDLRGPGAEAFRRRCLQESCHWARVDMREHSECSFPQALVVRLAIRLEARPDDILLCMQDGGLPASEDRRTMVKALLRLCHPDKCRHPEAKKAVQVLGPLLAQPNVKES